MNNISIYGFLFALEKNDYTALQSYMEQNVSWTQYNTITDNKVNPPTTITGASNIVKAWMGLGIFSRKVERPFIVDNKDGSSDISFRVDHTTGSGTFRSSAYAHFENNKIMNGEVYYDAGSLAKAMEILQK